MAMALLEYETLSGHEVDAVLRGEPIIRPEPGEEIREPGRRSSVPSAGKTAKERPAPGGLEAEPQAGA